MYLLISSRFWRVVFRFFDELPQGEEPLSKTNDVSSFCFHQAISLLFVYGATGELISLAKTDINVDYRFQQAAAA